MNRRLPALGSAAALAAIACLACATEYKMTVKPVGLAESVSGSAYLLTRSGAVAGPKSYAVLKHFSVAKTMKGRVLAKGGTVLDLDGILREQLSLHKGNAIVNLKIVPVSWDSGTTLGAGAAGTVCAISGGVGVMMLVSGLAFDSDVVAIAGGVFTGIGAVGGGVSLALMGGKTTMVVEVSGDVVRLK